ncbi:unnamed protein product, partial [Didymodactylos carnosus]
RTMRNLQLSYIKSILFSELNVENVHRTAYDSDKQIFYISTDHIIYSFDVDNDDDKSLRQAYETQEHSIEDLCYVSEINCLCIALSNGDLLSYICDDNIENIIGTMDTKIHAITLSPDQQILTIVSDTKLLLLSVMNEFEPIAEINFDTNEFGLQQFVNVGWGKQETQFHGSLGKKAALLPTSMGTKNIFSFDDCRTKISWRDDSDYFAVSFISKQEQCRMIKIYNKQGQLQATNDQVFNGCLEHSFAWKLSGESIAVPMRMNNGQKSTISFMEKNGLKHGDFELVKEDEKEYHVQHICWNKDSTILCIVLHTAESSVKDKPERNNSSKGSSVLQLWSTNNYHWYLKQCYKFESLQIQTILWDMESTNRIHFIFDNGQYRTMTWVWVTNIKSADNRTLACVIDGKKLMVTDFTHSSIPPPMCTYTIMCPSTIHSVVSSNNSNDQLLFALSNGVIALCKSSLPSSDTVSGYETIKHLPEITAHYIQSVIKIDSNMNDCTHFTLFNDQLYYIELSVLHVHNFERIVQSIQLDFLCLTTAIGQNAIYFESTNGEIFYLNEKQQIKIVSKIQFPRRCPQFSIVIQGNDEKFVGLTDNYRLYLNSNELLHNCNSYFIHDRSTIAYSTLQHQIGFISLTNSNNTHQNNVIDTKRRTGK